MTKPASEMTRQEIADYLKLFDRTHMIDDEAGLKLLDIARTLNQQLEILTPQPEGE